MANDIRATLSPLLTLSYIFGARIVEFPVDQPRLWYSLLYILILWWFYLTLLVYTVVHHIQTNSIPYQICFGMNVFTALLSVLLGMYHDKKFRSCLRKLAIVDDTLKKLGTTIDYHKLYTRELWTTFGWFVFFLWSTISCTYWHGVYNNTPKSLYRAFILEYPSCVNFLNDLIIINTLRYIELKFDQINEHIRKLEEVMGTGTKKSWEDPALQPRLAIRPKFMNNESVTWVVIHLHLELCKISRNLNSIFGLQMTVKMSTYFALAAQGFLDLFNVIMLTNYEHKGTLFVILDIMYLITVGFRFLLINYTYEKVSIKANAIGDVINRIPYSVYDVVTRENISQFLLQMSLIPLKFYGLGLFQFGFKFLQKFCTSVTTVIVILVQSHINNRK